MKAYDDLLDLDADESVSESIDAFADKLSKVTHKISHDILVINMERVHARSKDEIRPIQIIASTH